MPSVESNVAPHPSRRRAGTIKRIDNSALAAQMRAAQGGDLKAYGELLKTVTPLLRSYLWRRRGFLQRADAEDLVQEILLSVHAVRQTYDPARPFMPWFWAITHHRIADAARRHALRSAREAPAEEVSLSRFDLPAGSGANEEVFGCSRALRRALRTLPPRQRTALEFLKLRQMSLKEAAAEIGTSVGALKVSVHRAMASLRRSLIDDSSKG